LFALLSWSLGPALPSLRTLIPDRCYLPHAPLAIAGTPSSLPLYR
jgi:hypothetical protein